MRKKIFSTLFIFLMSVSLTGCVKFNANMDIKKDKSMDFSIIYAFDTSIFGDEELLTNEDKKKIEEQGFSITDYKQDSMKGFQLSRKIKNIDTISSVEDTDYNLSGILNDDENNKYVFKVQKGFLKNKYIAKFKFNASDSELNNSESTVGNDSSTVEDTDYNLSGILNDDENNKYVFKVQKGFLKNKYIAKFKFNASDSELNNSESTVGNDSSTVEDTENDSTDSFPDLDVSKLSSSLDLSFNVKLPYSAKSNNATKTENDNKNLTWSLSSQSEQTIDFEFELYNMTNIYVAFGGIVLIIVIIILIINRNKKSNNNSDVQQHFESKTINVTSAEQKQQTFSNSENQVVRSNDEQIIVQQTSTQNNQSSINLNHINDVEIQPKETIESSIQEQNSYEKNDENHQ